MPYQPPIMSNASWPPGKWRVTFDKQSDRYIITTEHGGFIASVGPTLVAYWLVKVYNSIMGEIP